MTKPKKRACPLCAKKNSDKLILGGRFELMNKDYSVSECKNCGFIYQNPAWPRQFYEQIYETLIYDPVKIPYSPEEFKRFDEVRKIIDNLDGLGPEIKLLDYGCYSGAFTEWLSRAANSKKIDFSGFDLALKDEAVKNSRYFNDLKKLSAEKKSFDVVTLNHVLEHVYEPVGLLKNIKQSFLRPNGYVVIEVPDTSYVRTKDFSPVHIQHVNYFTPETLLNAGKRAGLAPALVKTFRNYDIDRDPCYPSVIACFRNDPEYLQTGGDFAKQALKFRAQLKKRFENLPTGTKLAVVGCGDPLSLVIKMLPKKIELIGLYDNNKSLWDKKIFNLKIADAASLGDNSADAVFVCTVHGRKSEVMAKKLRSDGFRGKIMKTFDHD